MGAGAAQARKGAPEGGEAPQGGSVLPLPTPLHGPLALGNWPLDYSCSGTRGVVGRYYLPTFASVVPSATADVSVDEIPIYDLSVGRRYVALFLGFLIPFTCLSV